MRIRPNVVPTPIVSPVALQQGKAEAHPQPAVELAVPSAPPVQTEPLEIDLGDKKIQLQPGELAKVVEKVNETARIFNQALRFEMSEGHRVIVQVIDVNKGQVIREIPPERFMDLYSRMEDAVGLLFDMRA